MSKPNPEAVKKMAQKITEQLAKEGRLIEGGWRAAEMISLRPEAPASMRASMRWAYFAGAQHLFASLMSILDPNTDDEPTDQDMNRMTLINAELEAWAFEQRQQMQQNAPGGQA